MNRLKSKIDNKVRRAHRVRRLINRGNAHPRLSVFISNRSVYAQIIDDEKQVTLASANSLNLSKKTMTEQAVYVGKEIGQLAKKKKISKVTFDRGSKLYHGRVKALADAARNEGLEF